MIILDLCRIFFNFFVDLRHFFLGFFNFLNVLVMVVFAIPVERIFLFFSEFFFANCGGEVFFFAVLFVFFFLKMVLFYTVRFLDIVVGFNLLRLDFVFCLGCDRLLSFLLELVLMSLQLFVLIRFPARGGSLGHEPVSQ